MPCTNSIEMLLFPDLIVYLNTLTCSLKLAGKRKQYVCSEYWLIKVELNGACRPVCCVTYDWCAVPAACDPEHSSCSQILPCPPRSRADRWSLWCSFHYCSRSCMNTSTDKPAEWLTDRLRLCSHISITPTQNTLIWVESRQNMSQQATNSDSVMRDRSTTNR